jgi:heme/copper-type cytochrome/quinol oxidase subunit 2
MRPQSPVAFELASQATMWAFFIAAGIMAVANRLQVVWLQITGIVLLVVAASFGFYFAREAKRRKPEDTPTIRRIRFASSTTAPRKILMGRVSPKGLTKRWS